MARKKLSDVAACTIRLHIPTYKAILQFFALSPAGYRGSDAIRQLLYQFGLYCQEQMNQGRVATGRDLKEAEDIVFKALGNTKLPDDSVQP